MSADYFNELADRLIKDLPEQESLQLYFSGEQSDFARLNHNRVRQAGQVKQGEISIDLIDGQRHAAAHLELSWSLDEDLKKLQSQLAGLREQITVLPDDPHLLIPDTINDSHEITVSELVDSGQMLNDIQSAAEGLDLVGILANGNIQRGFANSMGQRNWYQRSSVNFDWSVYLPGDAHDKAVKRQYAGFNWDAEILGQKMAAVRRELSVLDQPNRRLPPDDYPVYLSPDALVDIIDMLSWGGFGLKSQRTGNSPLIRMLRDGQTLHPQITLTEDTAGGVAPSFTSSGFIRQPEVTLIENGHYRDSLVGPRSAREFNEPLTGSEHPQSLSLAPGDLAADKALETLGEGLFINNLWYCNYSDRNDCRITGMTRFACFWVEKGEIKAPIDVLRFDDSVYHMLGDQLLALTDKAEWQLDPSTYSERSTASHRLPGALIQRMRFTL